MRMTQHLKQVYELLSSLEQSSVAPPLSNLVLMLQHKRVFEHRKPEVRTYVAAVLTEILRLTIEKPMFGKEAVINIFGLFERILTGLNDVKAATYPLGVTVINDLVMSQAVALLIEACCGMGVHGGDDSDDDQEEESNVIMDDMIEPLTSFVSACLNVLNDSHDRNFESMMLESVVFILEELNDAGGVHQPVMDVILSQLIVELREGQGAVSQIVLQDESGTLAKKTGELKVKALVVCYGCCFFFGLFVVVIVQSGRQS